MKVSITTHWKSFTVKPSNQVTGYIRNVAYTKVETVTIKQLSEILDAGRTIACGVHLPTDEMKTVWENESHLSKKEQTKFHISKQTFKNQQVFAVDIDDGNLTLEQLKAKIERINIPYAIIYKTFSYREDEKRWRIVFVNDKVVYSEEDVKAIYNYLIWRLHPNEDYTQEELAKIDISGTDIARLTFGAKEIVELNEDAVCSILKEAKSDENYFEAAEFIEKVKLAKKMMGLKAKAEKSRSKKQKSPKIIIPELELPTSPNLDVDNYIQSLHEEFERTGTISPLDASLIDTRNEASIGDISLTFQGIPLVQGDSLTRLKQVDNVESELYDLSLDVKQLYEIICDNLVNLDDDLKPLVVDFTDRYHFIDQLKLTDLLKNDMVEVKADTLIHCLLAHHDDSTPSAKIISFEKNEDYQFYHCYGCGTTYRTFGFIDHIFESYALLEGRKHTTMDTINLVYNLLDIELGSKYQKRVERQIKHDRAFIRDLPADSEIAKLLRKKRMIGFYLDLYDIADMKLSFESILKDDTENSIAFIAANTYISRYMRRLDHEGSSQSQVNKKLNWMARVGLIEKKSYDELTVKEKNTLRKYKNKILQKENIVIGEVTKKDYKDKDMFVYRLTPLSDSLLRNVVDLAKNELALGCRSRGQSKAQTTATYGVKKSQSVYLYDNVNYTKEEQKYLKLAYKAVKKLLESQQYFTEKELDANIDKSRNHFKKADKERLRFKLLPDIIQAHNLSKRRCNKALRSRYNISDSVKCDILFVDEA